MSILETTLQYYSADITKPRPMGTLTLYRFLQSIQEPSERVQSILWRIRNTTDAGEKSELKKQLYAFTPAVIVGQKRCYAEIKSFTGLMPIDYDGLDPVDAVQLKHHLFHSCTSIIAAWLSPSGKGVRAMVAIPQVQTVEQYKALFHGFEQSEYGAFKGFDISCQNPVLPMFLSYDPDLLVGDPDEVVQWTKTYTPPPIVVKQTYKSDEQSTRIERIIARKINDIQDNGHPQLRAAAFALGGYVGAGLIDYTSAVGLINRLIDSNAYLTTKHRTADGYKKTARQMIEKGMMIPLEL